MKGALAMGGPSRRVEILKAKIRREGLKSAVKRVRQQQKDDAAMRDFGEANPDAISFVDVMFINGCDYSVPHPIRYRVDHQIQQLEACGLSTMRFEAHDVGPWLVGKARTFVIFRCPWTQQIEDFIALAKSLHKRVYYDIDDLVIDTKYTETIPFVHAMTGAAKEQYDDGVRRMGKTMQLCEATITTTEGMAAELSKYVPRVLINRNVASEEMVYCSERALYERDVLPNLSESQVEAEELPYWRWACEQRDARRGRGAVIGYFSGSITHNSDFEMILPALTRILGEYKDARLKVVGDLTLPDELKPYADRVSSAGFCDWHDLPRLIASVDINLAPLTEGVFNEAKSENKWLEASLVKVPTVASNLGAFAHAVQDGITGILCSDDPQSWYFAIRKLIEEPVFAHDLGKRAYEWCTQHATTTRGTGMRLARFIKEDRAPNVLIGLPSIQISGGVLVAMKHACMLQDAGYDVTIGDRANAYDKPLIEFEGHKLPVIYIESKVNRDNKMLLRGRVDQAVATLWDSLAAFRNYGNVGRVQYLVQNYETGFYGPAQALRLPAESTYCMDDVEYLTISLWCKDWLEKDYGQEVKFVPNGIDSSSFPVVERDFGGRIRILVEGDSASEYKNVDEAFRIVDKLDSSKYEIWYMSYNAAPKETYRVDKFLHAVPHDEVGEVYAQCHILLKTSILESFSYPPLEMMATGGYAVVVPNEGNAEYIRDGENCLTYAQGDLDAGVACIERIVGDSALRTQLREGGLATAASRDWASIAQDVVNLYR